MRGQWQTENRLGNGFCPRLTAYSGHKASRKSTTPAASAPRGKGVPEMDESASLQSRADRSNQQTSRSAFRFVRETAAYSFGAHERTYVSLSLHNLKPHTGSRSTRQMRDATE